MVSMKSFLLAKLKSYFYLRNTQINEIFFFKYMRSIGENFFGVDWLHGISKDIRVKLVLTN